MTDDELKRAIVSGSFGSVLPRSLQSALDRVRRMVRPPVSDNSTTLAPYSAFIGQREPLQARY